MDYTSRYGPKRGANSTFCEKMTKMNFSKKILQKQLRTGQKCRLYSNSGRRTRWYHSFFHRSPLSPASTVPLFFEDLVFGTFGTTVHENQKSAACHIIFHYREISALLCAKGILIQGTAKKIFVLLRSQPKFGGVSVFFDNHRENCQNGVF